MPLLWRHNGPDGVSNHQPHHCLLNRLFRRRSGKTSKLRVTYLCAGNSPGTGEFPAQMASNAENVPIWWRHHAKWVLNLFLCLNQVWLRANRFDDCCLLLAGEAQGGPGGGRVPCSQTDSYTKTGTRDVTGKLPPNKLDDAALIFEFNRVDLVRNSYALGNWNMYMWKYIHLIKC